MAIASIPLASQPSLLFARWFRYTVSGLISRLTGSIIKEDSPGGRKPLVRLANGEAGFGGIGGSGDVLEIFKPPVVAGPNWY